jgi:hypothetical protein
MMVVHNLIASIEHDETRKEWLWFKGRTKEDKVVILTMTIPIGRVSGGTWPINQILRRCQ